ncbi:MAG: hypothetical protein JSU74_07570 [Candidatus Zixiibacteriota bacterium]|nr:MAG: hypothetical protein JSU74_07570 [candidate division Zixibacteria bacterium]
MKTIKPNKVPAKLTHTLMKLTANMVFCALAVCVASMFAACSEDENPISSPAPEAPEPVDSLYKETIPYSSNGIWAVTTAYYVVVDTDCQRGAGPRMALAKRTVSYSWNPDPDAPSSGPSISVILIWEGNINIDGSQWSADCVREGEHFKGSGFYSDSSITGSYEIRQSLQIGGAEIVRNGRFKCDWSAVKLSEWPRGRPEWLDCEEQ